MSNGWFDQLNQWFDANVWLKKIKKTKYFITFLIKKFKKKSALEAEKILCCIGSKVQNIV